MSRTFHHGNRRIRIRGTRRDPADLRRLARALIELAKAEAEAQAERQTAWPVKPIRRTRQRRRSVSGAPEDGDAS